MVLQLLGNARSRRRDRWNASGAVPQGEDAFEFFMFSALTVSGEGGVLRKFCYGQVDFTGVKGERQRKAVMQDTVVHVSLRW